MSGGIPSTELVKKNLVFCLDLSHFLTPAPVPLSALPSQWDEVSGLDEEGNSVRIYQILSCQTGSSSSHWLRSGFIQRQGASQVYVELRFTMMECSSSTPHRSCKETFNLFYYQADSNVATSSYPPWMENPYVKVRAVTGRIYKALIVSRLK